MPYRTTYHPKGTARYGTARYGHLGKWPRAGGEEGASGRALGAFMSFDRPGAFSGTFPNSPAARIMHPARLPSATRRFCEGLRVYAACIKSRKTSRMTDRLSHSPAELCTPTTRCPHPFDGRGAMRIEVEITRQVEADEGRATPDPGRAGSGNLPNPVEIRSSNWRTYDGWGHLGERQKSQ